MKSSNIFLEKEERGTSCIALHKSRVEAAACFNKAAWSVYSQERGTGACPLVQDFSKCCGWFCHESKTCDCAVWKLRLQAGCETIILWEKGEKGP